MADPVAMFERCAAQHSSHPQVTRDAAELSAQYGISNQRGIPGAVALRGALHAEHRTAMTNTLNCFSNALMDTGSVNGLLAGRKIGQANLDYATVVRQTYDSLSR